MRIILVDDGSVKHDRLSLYLNSDPAFSDVTLTKVDCGFDARKILRAEQFDLLLLDILLPWRAGGDANDSGSRDLIEAILSDETLRRPHQIVGLSADADAAAQADPYFLANTWTVLRFDETSNAWLEAVGASVKYMIARASEAPQYDTDLLVVTALRDPEMVAVHRLPWNWRAEEPLDDATFIRRGSFTSSGKEFSVVTAVSDRMGMVAASVLASKAIALLRPRYVVMVGICAGFEGETKFGDVVLADPAWDHQSGKRVEEQDGTHTFKIDPHQLPVSTFVKSRMKQVGLDRNKLADIRAARDDEPGHDLRVLVGPMATGSAVIADKEIADQIKDQQGRKILAIEMEAYGIYFAAQHAGAPKPTAFALKAVCDFADNSKDNSVQKYASYASAAVMAHFFEKYMVELRGLAGQ